jgi:tetratricopeptide (TPR) repeat protein
MDNPDVGTLVLHRLAKVDGFTFSGTSAYAPKEARKAYEKGVKSAKKKKWEDAEKNLTKATTEYPKYAAAWFELGLVYQQQNKAEDAKRAYSESINADGKFLNPYAQLATMSAAAKNWEETANYSGKLIQLNPFFSSHIYFISGVANLNLNRLDTAEEHTREALKMDEKHRNPRISYLMGVILAQKQDYAGAAENMRAYLKFAPEAADTETVKTQLADLERKLSQRTESTQAQ